ncbi:MAG TPA: ethanolamine ammonia-lyase subunit EutC [Acidobacteriaceae bacterium]|jgi:ethanolamine ammonia-lyase small subunit|nr:ethanolamine ammonia-lyase subunit EutC [Acidobacteriaceae bacterium]
MAELKPSRTESRAEGDVWSRLRQLTPARIGLGRAGASLPTAPLLDFDLAHARARDAVHAAFGVEPLVRELEASGFADPLVVASEVRDRMEYLLRPDRGRILDETSRVRLQEHAKVTGPCDLALVIADGLSAVAPARHAVPLLREWRSESPECLPVNVTVVVAHCARVGLGDAIGEILQAKAVVVLIGERPGLSSPDSLGAYLTWAPRVGCTDAERNCISNIRPEGLPYADASRRLAWLLSEAQRLQLSGVALKDDSDEATSLPQPRSDELGR